MIEVVQYSEYKRKNTLLKSMYRDRAFQFKDRMGWDVQVSEEGEETDEYDKPGAFYIVSKSSCGSHAGSLRLMSMSGQNMLSDHFCALLQEIEIDASNMWECTRFCISPSLKPNQARRTVSDLLVAAGEFGLTMKISSFLAIFDKRMLRVYRCAGSEPKVLNSITHGTETICLGRWNVSAKGLQELHQKQELQKS